MKKYLFIAAFAALALVAGCAKIENKAPTGDTQRAIGFSNYTPKALTKADGTYASSTTLIDGKKFDVFAYATAYNTPFATSPTSALGTSFMNAVEVTYATGGNSDATVNTYSPIRYWPAGDTPDWLTFWAYYPVQSGNGITYTAPTGSNGLGTYAFTVAASAADMVDFMVSDVVNDKIYGTATGEHIAVNGVVPLTFRHQLAKIKVVFKTDNTDATTRVVLTDAKLENIKTTGTLSATYNASATPATSTDWGATPAIEATPKVFEVLLNGSDISNQVLTTSVVGGADADLFLMIPQTMVEKTGTTPQKITVNWDVKTFVTVSHASAAAAATAVTPGNDGLLSITHNSAVLYLDECVTTDGGNTQANIDWNKNTFVTYTITIGPKPIRFTATVAEWNPTEQNGYFNVN